MALVHHIPGSRFYAGHAVLTEGLLGTVPLDPAVYAEYIAKYAPTVEEGEEELATLPEDKKAVEEAVKADLPVVTGFHRVMVDGVEMPAVYNYYVRGFFKSACGTLRTIPDAASAKLTSYKQSINGMAFVFPRIVPIHVVGDERLFTRPLRAETAQGPRVALATSITLPAGSWFDFTVELISPKVTEEMLFEWCNYAQLQGFGQWRSGGWGTAEITIARIKE
jgi:hypothetical protein